MLVVITITELNYSVINLFCNFLQPFSYIQYVCGIKIFRCAISLLSDIATKEALSS